MIPADATLLRVFLNGNERWRHQPLYRAIVERARASHLAGASVFGVELGYGTHGRLHDASSEYTSYDMPITIELVDAAERIAAFADELSGMIGEGLVATRAVRVVRYAHGAERVGDSPLPDSRAEQADNSVKGGATMKIEGDALRVTVYIGSSDTWGGRNLAVALVERCRSMGIAGATAFRGIMGFGKQSIIHQSHVLALSTDLPEKVEIVDRPERIERLLPVLEQMIGGGLIVVEDIRVVRYMHGPQSAGGPDA